MKNVIIALITGFICLGTGQKLSAQVITQAVKPANSSDVLIQNLLNPSLSSLGNIPPAANFFALHRTPFSAYHTNPISYVIGFSAFLTATSFDGAGPYEPIPGYISSHNFLEYKSKLQRRKRYPKNFHFYQVSDNSILEFFD